MKPQHDFVAERAVAQHCEELFAKEPSAEDQAQELANFARKLTRQLETSLASQLGSDALQIACEEVGKRTAASLYKAIGSASANMFVKCGNGELPLLLSVEYGPALALTEQAFGGAVGAIESDLAQLPRSAWLVLEAIAKQIASGFSAAGEFGDAAEFAGSHDNPAKLGAFGKSERCLVWPTVLTLPGEVELPFRIVTSEEAFLAALETGGTGGAVQSAPADLATNALRFGDLPLPIHAILAELTMPVSQIAAQKPGDFIPFAPRREVPLLIGDKAVARGQIGALDDQVALNVTQVL